MKLRELLVLLARAGDNLDAEVYLGADAECNEIVQPLDVLPVLRLVQSKGMTKVGERVGLILIPADGPVDTRSLTWGDDLSTRITEGPRRG